MTTDTSFARASSVSLGITVVVLYALFVTAVFSGFATYIYRTEWTNTLTASDTGLMDVDNLIFTMKRDEALTRSIESHSQNRSAARDAVTAVEPQIAALELAIEQTILRRQNESFFVIADLRVAAELLPLERQSSIEDVIDQSEVSTLERASKGLALYEAAPSAQARDDQTLATQERLDAQRALFADLEAREADLTTRLAEARTVLARANDNVELYSSLLEEDRTRLAALRETLPLGSPERARMEALGTNLPGVGDLFQSLVSFPTIFLTLIVTIAAGGLGTVVAFSRRYYNEEAEPPSMSRLFVNIGEGIAAAIAIFLFSGAGMLALTQGSGAQNSVELSPYTVAFIAFVSGFMAEDAFKSIHSAGKKLFKNEPAEPAPADADASADVPPPSVDDSPALQNNVEELPPGDSKPASA
ncbi:hypothetical protein ACS3SW_04040 [Roseobacteraceae bacterium S113]